MLPKILIFPFSSSSCVWVCVCDFLDDRIKVSYQRIGGLEVFRGFYIFRNSTITFLFMNSCIFSKIALPTQTLKQLLFYFIWYFYSYCMFRFLVYVEFIAMITACENCVRKARSHFFLGGYPNVY